MSTPYRIQVSGPRAVALETTVLTHGLPRDRSAATIEALRRVCREEGAAPAFTAVLQGIATIGLDDDQLDALLEQPEPTKINTANLGLAMHRAQTGATTVSTTLELAAAAGIRVAATGGIGGVHPELHEHLDISSDLAALARFPVALVASGAKSVLDVVATRELLETLGVPVVGLGTDAFPAFYLAESGAACDASFDPNDPADLASYLASELPRTGRGVLLAQPAPRPIDLTTYEHWTSRAPASARGRDVTPALLASIHERSAGRSVKLNIELLMHNVRAAAQLAATMART